MVSQITSLTIVYSNVYSGADQRKHQISVSLAFVRGIHRWPVNSPHKGPVTRKMIPFDDVVMCCYKTCKHLRNFHRKIKQEYWLNVLQVRFNAWTTNAVLWCISCLFVKEKALKRYKDMLWIYMLMNIKYNKSAHSHSTLHAHTHTHSFIHSLIHSHNTIHYTASQCIPPCTTHSANAIWRAPSHNMIQTIPYM